MPTEPENAGTIPAYFVAEVEIHDPAGFNPYADQFASTLAPFGGRQCLSAHPLFPLRESNRQKRARRLWSFLAYRRVATGSPRQRIGRLLPSGKNRPTRALFPFQAFRFPKTNPPKHTRLPDNPSNPKQNE